MNGRLFNHIPVKIFLCLSLGLILILCCDHEAQCQVKPDKTEILSIGTGRIIDENIAAARKAAISDALSKGIEEYLVKFLGQQGVINNFQRLVQDILPGAGEGIENFHILVEDKGEKQYKILVRIKVNEKLIEEKLQKMDVILMKGPPIKLLFLVSQRKAQEGEISYWWNDPDTNTDLSATELALLKEFEGRGFSLANRLLSVQEDRISPEMRQLELTDENAVQWGRLYSSDVVILGNCEITEGEFVSVSLRALDLRTGSVMTEIGRTESITDSELDRDPVMEALNKVIGQIAVTLGPDIIRAYETSGEIKRHLNVEIRDLQNFEQLGKFRDFLSENIDGVGTIVQTRIKGRSITLSVEFSGEVAEFIDKVSGHDKFPFLADISQTEEGEIIIQIR